MIRINLLPSAHKRRKTGNPIALLIAGLAVTLIVVCGGLWVWQTSAIRGLKAQQDDFNKVLADYASQKAKIDEIRRNLATLQSRLAVKATILSGAVDIPMLLEELAAYVPKDVQITNATLGNGAITLNIITTSYSSAANALIAIETAPSFEGVETSSVSKAGSVSFTITGRISPRGGAPVGPAANY